MSTSSAQFLRFVLPHEAMDELVQEAKQLTWEHYCEHALLVLQNGRRVMVRGSRYAIELQRLLPNSAVGRAENQIAVKIQGEDFVVTKLVFHTHSLPTGPSDDDLLVLKLLGQSTSILYEIFGPVGGTEIHPK